MRFFLLIIALLAYSTAHYASANSIVQVSTNYTQGLISWPVIKVGRRLEAEIYGLQFVYRRRVTGLLGEPVENSNLIYCFNGMETPFCDTNFYGYPSVQLSRPIQDSQSSKAKAQIDLWGGDKIYVLGEPGGLWKVKYPLSRFTERARLTRLQFTSLSPSLPYGDISPHPFSLVGPFDGVYGAPGQWGWNVPGSPDWDEVFVKDYDYGDRSVRNIDYHHPNHAKEIAKQLLESCQPICEAPLLSVNDLHIDLTTVLADIGREKPEFLSDVMGNSYDTQTVAMRGLRSRYSTPQDIKNFDHLAYKYMNGLGQKISRNLISDWKQTAAVRPSPATLAQHAALTDSAECELITGTQMSDTTRTQLRNVLRAPDTPPELRRKGQNTLSQLHAVALGTGDVQVTLRWDKSSDVDLYVEEPGASLISYNNKRGDRGGILDVDNTAGYGPENVYWPSGQAPEGVYKVSVKLHRGRSTRYTVRIKKGQKVSSYSGYLASKSQKQKVAEFTFKRAELKTEDRCSELTITFK
jgi:hypothetical protein